MANIFILHDYPCKTTLYTIKKMLKWSAGIEKRAVSFYYTDWNQNMKTKKNCPKLQPKSQWLSTWKSFKNMLKTFDKIFRLKNEHSNFYPGW